MGNSPSKNASSTTAMTPDHGAGTTSVLAPADDGDDSIGGGSSGKPRSMRSSLKGKEGTVDSQSPARFGVSPSPVYTYQPDHATRQFAMLSLHSMPVPTGSSSSPSTWQASSAPATADQEYYISAPSSFNTTGTLSSSVSSATTSPSTPSSISSHSQGSSSLNNDGHDHEFPENMSPSSPGYTPTGTYASSTTSSGTITPMPLSPRSKGHEHQQKNNLHQQALANDALSPKPALLSAHAVTTSSLPAVSPVQTTATPSRRVSEKLKSKPAQPLTSSGKSRQGKDGEKRARKQHAVDVNELIQRLIDAGLSSSPSSKATRNLCITNNEIIGICRAARSIFLSQPSLLELGTPVQVVGDIHGQYGDLMRVFQTCGMPPHSNYLFLGDYVDRGKQSIETMLLLLCFKIRYPENVFLLRGNHECASVTKVYGFYDECKQRASVKVWKTFVDTFNTLPIAATIGGKIFCVHGGLSPYLSSLDDIRNIQRPTDIPDVGLLSDLLWSDPDSTVDEWSPNDRGISYCFGKSVVDSFCSQFKFDLIARGHMVVEDGYEFFNRRKLVTVFSAPNYCGEFGNWAAVMSVDKDLLCRFELLKPLDTNGVRRALKDSKFVGSINTTRATNLKYQG